VLKPEAVAPMVAYLCHEACPDNGAVYECGGGWIGRLRWQRSAGLFAPPDAITPEAVRDAWAELNDFSAERASYPTSNQEAFTVILDRATSSASSGVAAAGAGGGGGGGAVRRAGGGDGGGTAASGGGGWEGSSGEGGWGSRSTATNVLRARL